MLSFNANVQDLHISCGLQSLWWEFEMAWRAGCAYFIGSCVEQFALGP